MTHRTQAGLSRWWLTAIVAVVLAIPVAFGLWLVFIHTPEVPPVPTTAPVQATTSTVVDFEVRGRGGAVVTFTGGQRPQHVDIPWRVQVLFDRRAEARLVATADDRLVALTCQIKIDGLVVSEATARGFVQCVSRN